MDNEDIFTIIFSSLALLSGFVCCVASLYESGGMVSLISGICVFIFGIIGTICFREGW